MKRPRTQNPARVVAISGALIVALIIIAVASSVGRFGEAQHSYDRATSQGAQSRAVLGALRTNLLDRQTAVITYFTGGQTDPTQLAKLAPLQSGFDARVIAAQRSSEKLPGHAGAARDTAAAQPQDLAHRGRPLRRRSGPPRSRDRSMRRRSRSRPR